MEVQNRCGIFEEKSNIEEGFRKKSFFLFSNKYCMRINEDYIEDFSAEELTNNKPDPETDFVVPQTTSLLEMTGAEDAVALIWIDSFADETAEYAIAAMRQRLETLDSSFDKMHHITERSKFIVGGAELGIDDVRADDFSKWLVTNEQLHNGHYEKFIAFSFKTNIKNSAQMVLLLYRMCKAAYYALLPFIEDFSFNIVYKTDYSSSSWTRREVNYDFIKDVRDAAEEAETEDDSSWRNLSRYVEMFMPFMVGGRPKYPNFDKIAEELIDGLEDYVTE
jgi:hypothetical protein